MALRFPHRVRSEDFHGGIAGRGFMVSDDLKTFVQSLRFEFPSGQHLACLLWRKGVLVKLGRAAADLEVT